MLWNILYAYLPKYLVMHRGHRVEGDGEIPEGGMIKVHIIIARSLGTDASGLGSAGVILK